MPLQSLPTVCQRTGSESSFKPDPNEDALSSISGGSEVATRASLKPIATHNKTLRPGVKKVYVEVLEESPRCRLRKSTRPRMSSKGSPTYNGRTSSARPRNSDVKVIFEPNDEHSLSELSAPPGPTGHGPAPESPPTTPFTIIPTRRLRKRNQVQSSRSTKARYSVTKAAAKLRDLADGRKCRRDRKEIIRRRGESHSWAVSTADTRTCFVEREPQIRPESESGPSNASLEQERISRLEKENIILEEENETLRIQVDELCSRLGDGGSNNLFTTIVKDDVFFENGFANLNKMIRDFVREFLQTRFTSPFSPSRVPIKIRNVLNSEGTDWQKYLKGGKNKKVLRAIAHKYISFYLVENIIMDPVFRHSRRLRDAFSTIEALFLDDPGLCSRWRNRTIQDLRSTLPEPPLEGFTIDLKSQELFKDTKMLWMKSQESKEIERLKKITSYALKLGTELHKLPYEIQYGFSRDEWDRMPRDIDTHPEKEFYHINVHSRHSSFQFMTVFPGIRKVSRPLAKDGEDFGIVYLPLQLSAYD
ncbi:hypothetical protein TWF730_010712 [Orbilia blumenaviensis]|uniref:Uncharacterized protein n=1 Tax=Orbilia blumenaviensis TaxID=1796055 RepID=A0AAV9UVB9_9PEZI